MSTGACQKVKLLKLLEILQLESDEDHPLSTNQIIAKLNEQGIKVARKALYSDIKTLGDFGYEVLMTKNKSNYYYIVDRSFDIAELKILLDAIQAASFITEKKSKILIDKVAALAGSNRAALLKKNITCFDTTKHTNENIYYNVDVIDTSILNGKKVSFEYFDYGINGVRIYRKESERYIVNPIVLVFSDDNYYLVCYNDKYKNISNYRVDRMDKVSEDKDAIEPADCVKGFNIHKHKKQVFSMFLGDVTDIEFMVHKDIIDVVVDKFGEKVKMKKVDEDFAMVYATVQVSPTFYAWCFTFGNKLRIVAPYHVTEEIQARAKEILN
jgi:predicted DNA-binding transcriptional regulator YafY